MINKIKYIDAIRTNKKVLTAFVLSIIFLLISLFFVGKGSGYLWLVPLFLILILLAIVEIDKFLFLTVFMVPLSVQLRFIVVDPPADLSLPTEPMLVGILILMIFKIFTSKEINRNLLTHPLTIVSLIILGWSFLTSFTGTMVVISLKSFLMKLWFITGFYLLAAEIFRKNEKVRTYFLAYIFGMIPVSTYFLWRMWKAGIFNQKFAHSAIRPFFNDHTSFGAVLAFCIPLILYLIISKKTGKTLRIILIFLLLLFSAAFVFSYSRAAWLSLVIAIIFSIIIILKIPWKAVFITAGTVLIIFVISWSAIILKLNENKQESSGDIGLHLQSIANIRSDASNMERLNRWRSALRMFSERPLLGWGPATYQFKYAPFQIASEKTVISTNYGEGGNAHSEYLGSLVDSGIPGLFLYVLLLVIALTKGIKSWQLSESRDRKMLMLALMAGLMTYVIHGGLNNFLDTDKISALFWGFIAAIAGMDIRNNEEKDRCHQNMESQRDYQGN